MADAPRKAGNCGDSALNELTSDAQKAQVWCADSETKMARLMRAIFSIATDKVRTWLRGYTTADHAGTTAFSNVGRQRMRPVSEGRR